MRPQPAQRALICCLARRHLATAGLAAKEREKGREVNAPWLGVEAGITVGMIQSIQALSPGRHRHYRELAERIARRYSRTPKKRQPLYEPS